jgi:hypothetical protein
MAAVAKAEGNPLTAEQEAAIVALNTKFDDEIHLNADVIQHLITHFPADTEKVMKVVQHALSKVLPVYQQHTKDGDDATRDAALAKIKVEFNNKLKQALVPTPNRFKQAFNAVLEWINGLSTQISWVQVLYYFAVTTTMWMGFYAFSAGAVNLIGFVSEWGYTVASYYVPAISAAVTYLAIYTTRLDGLKKRILGAPLIRHAYEWLSVPEHQKFAIGAAGAAGVAGSAALLYFGLPQRLAGYVKDGAKGIYDWATGTAAEVAAPIVEPIVEPIAEVLPTPTSEPGLFGRLWGGVSSLPATAMNNPGTAAALALGAGAAGYGLYRGYQHYKSKPKHHHMHHVHQQQHHAPSHRPSPTKRHSPQKKSPRKGSPTRRVA